MSVEQFFYEWDIIEQMHPWGVPFFTPLFQGFGVASSLCQEVDSRLFLDLMIQVHPSVRLIRVEGRFSSVLFWVHVEMRLPFALVSFQRQPLAPLERSVFVVASPSLIVACILGFHQWRLGSSRGCLGRCRRIDAAKFNRVE